MKRHSNASRYLLSLIFLFVLVAVLRWDLFMGAFHATLAGFRKGPAAQFHLLFELVLFLGILLMTLRVIPTAPAPKRDIVIVLASVLAGALAETWGTRTGLWTYYTREAPPLWVIPVWPLGALVIDRMQGVADDLFSKRLGPDGVEFAYWFLAALCLGVFLMFSRTASDVPTTWVLAAVLVTALAVRPEPKKDIWIMAAGMFYVFFADLWGTTNNCWRYHIQGNHSAMRLLAGVSFGMFFDTGLVLSVLKITRILVPVDRRVC